MASHRKRCMVRELKEVTVSARGVAPYKSQSVIRCDRKIKPGTPFCKVHFETHKLVVEKCTGDAHSNPFIDHCMVCLPHWGSYPKAVLKDAPGEPWEGSWE